MYVAHVIWHFPIGSIETINGYALELSNLFETGEGKCATHLARLKIFPPFKEDFTDVIYVTKFLKLTV